MVKKKVALLTNIVSPYRVPLFSQLASIEESDLIIFLFAREERNRRWSIDKETLKFKYKILPGATLAMRTRLGDIRFLHFNPSIIWELCKSKFDIVICGAYNNPTAIIAFIICKLLKIPFVLWSEAIERKDTPLLKRMILRLLIPGSSAYLAYGTRAKELLIRYKAKEDRIFIVGNPIDNVKFGEKSERYHAQIKKIKAELNILLDNKILLYVGQLIERKGISNLIKAFKDINEEFSKVTLLIVGNGDLEGKIKEHIYKNKLDNIILLGFKQQDELSKYYAISDIFIFPSLGDVWGLVINEAMVHGLPIVTTSETGATGDIVIDKENGYVVNPGDIQDLTNTILNLLHNEDLRCKMGKRSLEIIEDWGIERFVKEVKRLVSYGL